MYESFFGFREKPFKLIPNPAYLFLSRSHEEALAHLTYATRQGDGFVAVIGEVGTGKTILCRSFLENLDKQTEAAFIFNPKLDPVQLLKSVNDEFAIEAGMDDPKALIDTLNAFLLEQRSRDKTVILLIDEAQNLTRDVLEQLRLISNLETTSHKLIQIILVGQPELLEMLESHELRQLGQRIALRSHLEPLAYHETLAYIQHRILVASRKPGIVFSPGAYRRIYKYSGGIPRLINIVCDRTLLIAFGLNRMKISSSIVKAAVRELTAGRRSGHKSTEKRVAFILIACFVCGVLFLLVPRLLHTDAVQKAPPPEKKVAAVPVLSEESVAAVRPVAAAVSETVEIAQPAEEREIDLADVLKSLSPRESRRQALGVVLDLWGAEPGIDPHLEETDDSLAYFTLAARQHGLTVERIVGDLDRIKRLNLPVILEFSGPDGMGNIYLTASRINAAAGDRVTLRAGERTVAIEWDPLSASWSGVGYLPWKNFLNLSGNIPLDNPKDAVPTVKILLRDIGFHEIVIDAAYDLPTREAVETIQRKHRLLVDGVVGSHTKIALYNEWKKFDIPHLSGEVPEKALEN